MYWCVFLKLFRCGEPSFIANPLWERKKSSFHQKILIFYRFSTWICRKTFFRWVTEEWERMFCWRAMLLTCVLFPTRCVFLGISVSVEKACHFPKKLRTFIGSYMKFYHVFLFRHPYFKLQKIREAALHIGGGAKKVIISAPPKEIGTEGVGSWILQHFRPKSTHTHTSWLQSLVAPPLMGRFWNINQPGVFLEKSPLSLINLHFNTVFFGCGIHPADGIHRKQWGPQPQRGIRRVVEGLESLAISNPSSWFSSHFWVLF